MSTYGRAGEGGAGAGITALTGAVTASGPGSAAATIAADAVTTAKILDANVTLAKLANLAQSTVQGRAAGAGTGVPTALTAAQLTALLVAASASLPGSLAVADFNKLATVPTGGGLPGVWVSGVLDLVNDAVGTTKTIVPLTAGQFWVGTVVAFVVQTIAGVCVTAPQVSVGTDGSHVNVSAQGTIASAATINATGARMRTSMGNLIAPSIDAAALTGELKVQGAGTGGFALTGVWVAVGYMSPT